MNTHTKELEYLLNNYWCVKEENPKEYFEIKNNLDYYKDFIRDKLGSRLIVNDRFIKLEKIPATPKVYMGITLFTDKLEYIIQFIVLLFLEDKPKLEQFILSDLTSFITNTATTLELNTVPDWNIFHHRKCLVSVMKHLEDLSIIRIVEEASLFTEDAKAEALYETTGISNYYVREFKGNIVEYNSISDYSNDEFADQNEFVGDVRRYHIYRSLLYGFASYTEDLTEYEMDYLRKFRGSIKNELEKYTNGELELTRNMALLMVNPESKEKDYFPNAKAISDILLLVNNAIVTKVTKEELALQPDETIFIAKEQMHRIIKEVRQEYQSYFSKNHREMILDKFIEEVIYYLKEYDFIKETGERYIIYPSVARMVGYIPKEKEVQLSIFEGVENE